MLIEEAVQDEWREVRAVQLTGEEGPPFQACLFKEPVDTIGEKGEGERERENFAPLGTIPFSLLEGEAVL